MDSIYVVYLTFYSGNRLPPFYIGYTTEAKINKGYNGSVSSKKYKSIWVKERCEHPELFKTVILSRHKTDTEAIKREEYLQKFFRAPNNPMFINLSYSRGKFGAAGENNGRYGTHIPSKFKGTSLPEELRKKCVNKGPHPRHSEKTKEKQRLVHLGKKHPLATCPHCGKIGGARNMKRWHFDNCQRKKHSLSDTADHF